MFLQLTAEPIEAKANCLHMKSFNRSGQLLRLFSEASNNIVVCALS